MIWSFIGPYLGEERVDLKLASLTFLTEALTRLLRSVTLLSSKALASVSFWIIKLCEEIDDMRLYENLLFFFIVF